MTVPVANPGKVKRRRQSQASETTSVGEKSYDLDHKDERRARRASVEEEFDSPSRVGTTRQKKRQLEQRFGSSAPTLPSPTAPSRRNQFTTHHSVPVMRKYSDDSLVFDPEEARLVPSKASQSLNGYIENGAPKKSRAGSKASGSTSGGGAEAKRKVQLRDTDRLLRSKSGLERQNSGILPRRGSHVSQGQQSVTGSMGSAGTSMGRGRSPEGEGGLARSQSVSRTMDRPSMTRSGSKTMGPRSKSVSADLRAPPTRILTKQVSLSSDRRAAMKKTQSGSISSDRRAAMKKGQSGSVSVDRRAAMKRGQSGSVSVDRRAAMKKGQSEFNMGSRRSIMTGFSQATVINQGENMVVLVPVTREQAKEMAKAPPGTIPSMFKGYFQNIPHRIPPMEEKPPRSLVLIWVLISAELAFDLGSTVVAFTQLLEQGNCCGEAIELGPVPMTVTIPFFLLVTTELALLLRAMALTIWPSLLDDEITEEQRQIRNARSRFMQMFCCYLRWNAKFILRILNFLVLVNPFFGCVIAWMLLYQSNKLGCFIVLGLEGASILLHFATVYLEGSCKTLGQVLFQSIPLIPFFLSVSLVLVYLKQGGVCYLVEEDVFMFTGCELCPNEMPPIDNMCLYNGTNYTIRSDGFIDLKGLNDLSDIKGALTERVMQGEYCGNQLPDGPDISFCWYDYSESN